MAGARRRLGEVEFELRGRCRDLLQHRERGCHHFRPDAVARQYRDMEAVVGEHVMLRCVFGKNRRWILAQRAPQAPERCQRSVSTRATTAVILNCPCLRLIVPGLTHFKRGKSDKTDLRGG
jgi:hypothetical protein